MHATPPLAGSRRHDASATLRGVIVIIPARNEEHALGSVLDEAPEVGHVVVVDNGSTDRTPEVARSRGCTVVYEGRAGYGSACLAGLAEVERCVRSGGWESPQVIAFLDGDHSDFPECLPGLVAPILAGRVDFVLGSRLLGAREPGAMPIQSLLGNRLACCLMRLLWGVTYTDLGPFRAIRFDALRALKMQDRGFGWTIEMQIKAAVAGLRTEEHATPYRRRIGKSKISGTVAGTLRASAAILYTIAKHGIGCLGRCSRTPEPEALPVQPQDIR